jgi:uncharacterized protein YjbJ (UPF0337 family)
MDEMKHKAEQVKGHAKEAAGEVTGDDRLKAEGRSDRTAGKIKEKVDEARDKVVDAVDDVKDRLRR